MISLCPNKPTDLPLTILCLGAHSDDIEIGCGGTILKLQEIYSLTSFYWVVLGADGHREAEARKSACEMLAKATHSNVVLKNFRNSYFPYIGEQIKDYFEEIKKDVTPDIVLTHYREDRHQDHRTVSELTWNTFRDHCILEYEVPKYDGDFGSPNMFVSLDEAIVRKKVDSILSNFESQRDRQWFDRETFLSIMRLRGMESNAPSRYAEAFYCRKAVLC